MKVSPKDMPKAFLMVVVIVGLFVYIGSTLSKHSSEAAAEKKAATAPAPNLVAGDPSRTAALEPQATPQQYVEQIESWSKPPAAPQGDPFREVLPRDILNSMRQQAQNRTPVRDINGSFGPGSSVGFDPTNPGGMPDVRIDFPTIEVQGVVVDTSSGAPTNFATLLVDGAIRFAKAGEPIGNDLVVEKVTQMGVQIRAAREHAFIEVAKSYKPNGMAPAAPQGAAGRRRSTRRR